RRTVLLSVTGLVVGAVCFTSGITFLGLVALVYLVVPVLIVSRLRRRRIGTGRRLSVNHLVFWTLVALTVLPGTYDVLRADFGDGYPIFIAGMVALPAAAIVLTLVPRRRTFAATNALVAIGSVFLATQLAITYRPASDGVAIDSPLAGEWYVGHGGNAELVNYHHIATNQRDAVDILKVHDNSTHAGAGHNLDDYYAFGEPVLSPGDGVITAATGTLSDEPVGTVDLDHPEGNVVVVDIGAGRYVVLAHLRQNSLQVAVGDRVHTGQPIAQVGNSGNTDEPHLHLQIQNRPQLDATQVTPGLTTSAVVLRNTTVNNRFHPQTPLRRGDHFTSNVSG
ncbi:MAG TPA: M23 family metallopeptidase, partial [Kribbella sp.]|nr:M23 family metallopeptidase [Kribbella sp.]